MKTYFMTVDFDYFVRVNPMWDWGAGLSDLFIEIAWAARLAGAAITNWDIKGETDPARWAMPKPLNFAESLALCGLNIREDCQVTVSDSHLFAYDAFYIENCDEIISFDAHHDLGYKTARIERAVVRETNPQCEDWLLHVLLENPDLRARVVYPEWKEDWLGEWEIVDAFLKAAEGVEDTPWSRVTKSVWPLVDGVEGEVAHIHLCKSSPWTPPWLDPLFVEFVNSFGLPTETYEHDEGVDPLQSRQYNEIRLEGEPGCLTTAGTNSL